MKSVYVASSLVNWKEVKSLQTRLEMEGFFITHDWASIAEQELLDSQYHVPDTLSQEQIQAATSVDLFIFITPGGRGAHVEYGAAIGTGVPTIVVLGTTVNIIGFYKLANHLVHDPEEAFRIAVEDYLSDKPW
jgi:hypothetical protein